MKMIHSNAIVTFRRGSTIMWEIPSGRKYNRKNQLPITYSAIKRWTSLLYKHAKRTRPYTWLLLVLFFWYYRFWYWCLSLWVGNGPCDWCTFRLPGWDLGPVADIMLSKISFWPIRLKFKPQRQIWALDQKWASLLILDLGWNLSLENGS